MHEETTGQVRTKVIACIASMRPRADARGNRRTADGRISLWCGFNEASCRCTRKPRRSAFATARTSRFNEASCRCTRKPNVAGVLEELIDRLQ